MPDSAASRPGVAGMPRIGDPAPAFTALATQGEIGLPAGQPQGFLELVRVRERDALAALAQATGDTSLCALSRAGAPHPAAKFHEGAASALAAVRRTVSQRPGTDPADAVDAARVGWEGNAALADRGRDWAAYYAGGVEALDLLAEAVTAPSGTDGASHGGDDGPEKPLDR